jgi:hypothetical protein
MGVPRNCLVFRWCLNICNNIKQKYLNIKDTIKTLLFIDVRFRISRRTG